LVGAGEEEGVWVVGYWTDGEKIPES
jgi:hypothetical protein